ncbi:MAG: ABC-2 family transporter permease [Planctomycetota bacterium]
MRGGTGLIFLLLVMVGGLLVAHIVFQAVEVTQKQFRARHGEDIDQERLLREITKVAKPFVSWALGEREEPPIPGGEREGAEEDAWAAYLLEERPALLSAILLVLLFMLPFMSVLGSFNQYSGDVGTKGIRYQLLRTERANIYFGRFLGTILYFSLTLALLLLTIVAYMGVKLEFYGWGELLRWGVWGWLSLTILSIPYVALCGLISGAIDTPFGALVLCALAILGVPLFALIGGLQWEEARHIKYLLPWATQNYLLHHSFAYVGLAIGACLGYTAVFLTLGYRHFAKRDL